MSVKRDRRAFLETQRVFLYDHAVGYAEEAAIAHFSGDLDVYVSKFRPLKHTLSGRLEKTLMKLIVHVQTDRVVGVHM